VCCAAACDGACEACGDGTTCGLVGPGQQTAACQGDQACDEDGACLKANGGACDAPSECASNLCGSGGVCCAVECFGACVTCAGGAQCSPVPEGVKGPSCDGEFAVCGKSGCTVDLGGPCNADGDCLSGSCGRTGGGQQACCKTPCLGPCMTCESGACTPMAAFVADPACGGIALCVGGGCKCDGAGACKLPQGSACSDPSECLSGVCSAKACG
jgi:hypothetical protein